MFSVPLFMLVAFSCLVHYVWVLADLRQNSLSYGFSFFYNIVVGCILKVVDVEWIILLELLKKMLANSWS